MSPALHGKYSGSKAINHNRLACSVLGTSSPANDKKRIGGED